MESKKVTAADRIRAAVQNHDMEADDINKLLALAYYMGREEAAKEVSDMYNKHIAEQKKRAEACRYYKMAREVVGTEDYLYSSDYAGEMSSIFGGDETKIRKVEL